MADQQDTVPVPETLQTLRLKLAPYGKPELGKSLWQVVNTLVPYGALWVAIVYAIRHQYSVGEIVALILLASFFLVRVFILFHDCAHGSLFASPWATRILGYVTGILTFTPYESWAHPHNIHHATYADLDHRGVGDIRTLTREEYLAAPRLKRLGYRLYRSPLVLLGPGPVFLFLIGFRFPRKGEGREERHSIWITNLAVAVVIGVLISLIGWRTYLLIQLPIVVIGATVGVWLFYVQHQFEGVYWTRHADWDPMRAALSGSSYYRLPKILQWFTGSIGLHHVHHVLPRIPNYNLQRAYEATPLLQTVRPLTLAKSLRSLRLNLWDEQHGRLISFRSLRQSAQSSPSNNNNYNPGNALPA